METTDRPIDEKLIGVVNALAFDVIGLAVVWWVLS
jgi:hypothetical protein